MFWVNNIECPLSDAFVCFLRVDKGVDVFSARVILRKWKLTHTSSIHVDGCVFVSCLSQLCVLQGAEQTMIASLCGAVDFLLI